MDDPHIIEIGLDDGSIIRRSDAIEQEKNAAIADLLAGNYFRANGHEGPYRLLLRVEDNRLAVDVRDALGAAIDTIRLGLARFRRPIRNYFAICESYFQAVASGSAKGLEPIDMARRALHNEAAETLRECLTDQADMDFDTARRLFTLICVLHIR